MNCNNSLPNKRLKSVDAVSSVYLEGRRDDYIKKISALQSIVHNVVSSLLKASKAEIPNNNPAIKLLLDDTLNTCKFSVDDLQSYFEFTCDVLCSMRDNMEMIDNDHLLKSSILESEKVISALTCILLNSKNRLDDEVTHKEKFLKEDKDSDFRNLLDDVQHTCKYCYVDLKVFCNLIDETMYTLQKIFKSTD